MSALGSRSRASTARGGGRGRGGAGHIEEEEDGERWLVTYADMLTVMLALFIVLYAISALNESKFVQLKNSLSQVLGDGSVSVLDGGPSLMDAESANMAEMPGAPMVPIPENPAAPGLMGDDRNATQPGRSNTETLTSNSNHPGVVNIVINTNDDGLDAAIKTELENFDVIKSLINESLDEADMTGAVQFDIDRRGLIVTVVTNALVFSGNSATLLPRGEKLLSIITPALAEFSNNIEVDGFTNQVDVSTYPYPSGWELSSARASSVVRYFEAHGLDDRQLAAVGYSDQRPLVSPDDPRSIERNRRVEIVVLSTLPPQAADALEQAATAGDGTNRPVVTAREAFAK